MLEPIKNMKAMTEINVATEDSDYVIKNKSTILKSTMTFLQISNLKIKFDLTVINCQTLL